MSIATIDEIKNTKGRIMGVDFGEVRTGIAISDASRFLASGIGYIKEGGLHKTAEKIAEMVKEENTQCQCWERRKGWRQLCHGAGASTPCSWQWAMRSEVQSVRGFSTFPESCLGVGPLHSVLQ